MGISVNDPNTNLQIVNDTIYGYGSGITATSSRSNVVIRNTIMAGRTVPDQYSYEFSQIAMMFVDVQNSLLSANASLIGSNNLRGDPLFTNPVANDFTLMAGSPAIDAGSNSAVNLPFKDHYEKYRNLYR
jgi:hypothetical protein